MPLDDGTSFSMPTDPDEVIRIWNEKDPKRKVRHEVRDGKQYLVKEKDGDEVWNLVERSGGGKERR